MESGEWREERLLPTSETPPCREGMGVGLSHARCRSQGSGDGREDGDDDIDDGTPCFF